MLKLFIPNHFAHDFQNVLIQNYGLKYQSILYKHIDFHFYCLFELQVSNKITEIQTKASA
jgi:hypothetical protein